MSVGSPGCGKSTWVAARVRDIARTTGALVVGFDPGYRVPTKDGTGAPIPSVRAGSIAELDKALRSEPRRLCLLANGDAADLIGYARQLATASLNANGGSRGVPVMILLDEAVLIAGADTYRLDSELKRLLAGRRHEHLGFAITMQEATFAHKALLALATEVAAFRCADPVTIARLRACGFDKDELARLPNLPRFRPIIRRNT